MSLDKVQKEKLELELKDLSFQLKCHENVCPEGDLLLLYLQD